MPVTELARLQVLSSQNPNSNNTNDSNDDNTAGQETIDPNLLADFKFAQDVLTKSSTHQFQLYRSIDQQGTLYIVGSWESVAFHRKEFLPSSENQHLLQTLQGKVDVDFMFHLAIDQSEKPILSNDQHESKTTEVEIQTGSLTIVRHFLSSGQSRSDFERHFHHSISELRSAGDDGLIVVGGWKIDESDSSGSTQSEHSQEDDEFVLFVSSSAADPDSDSNSRLDLDLYASRMQDYCGRPIEIARVIPLQY